LLTSALAVLCTRGYSLLTSGYSIGEIAKATMEVEKIKKERADSLRSAGYSNPWEMLSGAVETTGAALKRVDVLGVGTAAGVVVGAGVVAGTVAGNAVGMGVFKTVQGVTAVVGVGADFTAQTGRMLVGGVQASSRKVTDVATGVATGVAGASMAVAKPVVGVGNTLVVKPVTKVVTTTGKVITTGGKAITTGVTTTGKAIGTGITTTGRAVGTGITTTGRAVGTGITSTGRAIGTVVSTTGSVVTTTGRAVGSIVTLGAISWGSPAKDVSPKNSPSQDNPKQLKRPTSINNSMSTLTGISTPQSQ
jgi:hypothetical protein